MVDLEELNNCYGILWVHKNMLYFPMSFKDTKQLFLIGLPSQILHKNSYLGSFCLAYFFLETLNVHSIVYKELSCTIHELFLNQSL